MKSEKTNCPNCWGYQEYEDSANNNQCKNLSNKINNL
ncbi:hypothetical protein SAMN04489761_2800 [Tenacibaculum sp. MAR_2009_124]|nr:hypothetical protein SAMN04489761_2800 [Tenacibaculum sp. MAR_2009_124]